MAKQIGVRKEKSESEKSAALKLKAERFSKLASKRVGKAIKAISLIGNLSGGSYAYTVEQTAKINTLLTDSVKAVVARFAPGSKVTAEEIKI